MGTKGVCFSISSLPYTVGALIKDTVDLVESNAGERRKSIVYDLVTSSGEIKLYSQFSLTSRLYMKVFKSQCLQSLLLTKHTVVYSLWYTVYPRLGYL